MTLKTTCGRSLCIQKTYPKITHHSRWTTRTEPTEGNTLHPGDRIVLRDGIQASEQHWKVATKANQMGYLIGLLIGDGTIKKDKTLLSVWLPEDPTQQPGVRKVMHKCKILLQSLEHRSDFTGWIPVKGRREYRMTTAAFRDLAYSYGLNPDTKTITAAMRDTPLAFQAQLLSGLFDADGCVLGDTRKGISVRLAQNDMNLLQTVQAILETLGINAVIYANRRTQSYRKLPNGKGGLTSYLCEANHELSISKQNLLMFQERVGFTDMNKAILLKSKLSSYKRTMNREHWIATIY